MNNYTLGNIPHQRFWGLEMVQFHIAAPATDSNTVLTAQADKQLDVKIEEIPPANSGKWLFTYRPEKKKDRAPFSVTFKLSGGKAEAEQTVHFEPMPILPPERTFVNSSPGEPDRTLYKVARVEAAGEELFNTREQSVKKVYISGFELIFDPGKDEHSFTGYDKSPDYIKEMHITADRLIIRQCMHLPQTDVFVTARELIMEDGGTIDTTPIDHTSRAEPDGQSPPEPDGKTKYPGIAVPGADGAKGGDIQLNIGSLRLPSGNTKRFILRGAKGQEAGKGLDGGKSDNLAMEVFKGDIYNKLPNDLKDNLNEPGLKNIFSGWDYKENRGNCVYVKVHWEERGHADAWGGGDFELGKNEWPEVVRASVPPGKSGNGGDGGSLVSSVVVRPEVVDIRPGDPGKDPDKVKPRQDQSPSYPCYHLQLTMYRHVPDMKWTAKKLRTFPPEKRNTLIKPDPDYPIIPASAGKAGSIKIDPNLSWLEGHVLLPQISRAIKDAFLLNNRDMVNQYLETYLPVLTHEIKRREQAKPPIPVPAEDYAMQTELAMLRHRLENHLDYFGNPAGWTPLLSLQANLKAYDNEIDRAMKTLFLAHWVDKANENETSAILGLENSIKQLEDDTREANQALKNLQSDLPDIQGMVDRLNSQIDGQNKQLATLLDRLKTQAKDNIEERHSVEFGMSMLTAVTSIIPFGQPALSAAGQVTSALVTSQYKDTKVTQAAIGNALASAGAAGLNSAAEDIIQAADDNAKVSDKLSHAKTRANNLKHVAANLGPAVENITTSFQNLGASQDEVEVELARLAAQNPEFQDSTKQIARLNRDKVEFANQLTATTQAITDAYDRIAANALAVASFQGEINIKSALLDESTLRHVKEMQRRAEEVLVRYQYYLVKSYESMWLKPYEKADYQLDLVTDKITELLTSSSSSKDGDGNLTENQFNALKAVFTDNLDQMTRELLENLRPEYTVTQWLTISDEDTPEVMRELNQKGETRINLMDFGMVLPDYENVRISDISVEATRGIEVDPEAKTRRGTVQLDFTLSGDGTIRSDGDLYVVRHPTVSGLGNTGESGLRWGVSYNVARDKLVNVRPSSSFTSLLRHLLKDDSQQSTVQDTQLQFLSSPAAWTDIIISKSVTDTSQPIDVHGLTVKFELSYSSAPRNQCVLHVTTRGGHRPLIRCNRKDLNGKDGKDDAYGQMYRIFRRGAQVTLTAPAAYGRFMFSHYEILNAHTLQKNEVNTTDYTFDMQDDYVVVCVYSDGSEPGRPGLAIGKTARVKLGGVGNRLRNAPSLEGDRIGLISPGDTFKIVGGPKYSVRYTWWQVSYRGKTGWTVDGLDGEYWLEVVGEKPSSGILVIGGKGRVKARSNVNIREQPKVAGKLVGKMTYGDTFVVLAGPVKRDNYTWWQVRNIQNVVGWVAEGDSGGELWLEAA